LQKQPENIFYNPTVVKKVARRNLPHWQQSGKMYFSTFRTADSIPQAKIELFRRERQQWQQKHTQPYNEQEKAENRLLFSDKMNTWLDNCHGECLLAKPACAEIVKNAIEHFEGDRYRLDHWVIMRNHVHILLVVEKGYELGGILHSWKSFTSNEINKIYSRTGTFWQAETFDHIVRSNRQLEKYREYIKMNVCKAGVSWSEKSIHTYFPEKIDSGRMPELP
jgi:REP element-mobilizing transposase RayT